MSENLITFENVSYSYEEEPTDENSVLHDVSFHVGKGEFIAVLGHNGSGKSTIAKLANGIFLPTGGRVMVDGIETTDEKKEFEIRKKVGVVFQNPDNQIVASIVEEDVAFGPENLGIPPAEIRQRVDDSLKATGIYHYRYHETHRLSGGQKQRVAIAGIIAMQPDCIVLDEPTAMLDPSGRADVMSTINKLNKDMGKSVILITHFMEEATRADRIIVLHKGRIIKEGSPKEIFADSEIIKTCGLDIPEITKVGNELKKAGVRNVGTLLEQDELIALFKSIIGK